MEALDKVPSANTAKEHRRLRQLELPDEWIRTGADSWQGLCCWRVTGRDHGEGTALGWEGRHVSPHTISEDGFIGLLKNKPTNQKWGREKRRNPGHTARPPHSEAIGSAGSCKSCSLLVNKSLRAQALTGPRQPGELNTQLHHGAENARNLPPYGFEQKPETPSILAAPRFFPRGNSSPFREAAKCSVQN